MTIDTAEAARRLGLTRRRITALIQSGKLPAKRIGERVWLIESADLKLVQNRKPGRPKKIRPGHGSASASISTRG